MMGTHRGQENQLKRPSFEKLKDPFHDFLKGDWERFVEFFKDDPDALRELFSAERDTAFHLASLCGDPRYYQKLVDMVMVKDANIMWELLNTKSLHGYTPLHCASSARNPEIADIILQLEKQLRPAEHQPLLEIKNALGETPAYVAAIYGATSVLKRYAQEDDLRKHYNRDADKISMLHIAVLSQHFETALWLLKYDEKLADEKEDNGLTSFQLLAKMPCVFRSQSNMGILDSLVNTVHRILPKFDNDNSQVTSGRKRDEEIGEKGEDSPQEYLTSVGSKWCPALSKALAKGWGKIHRKMWEKQRKFELAEDLVRVLVEKDKTWEESEYESIKAVKLVPSKYPQTDGEEEDINANPSRFSPLLIAASTGITEIVETILTRYPQAIEHIGKDGQSLLHIAVKHRQLEIYRLIKNFGGLPRLNYRTTAEGNTILHQAASTQYYRGGKRPGFAFQLQEELQWFQRANRAIPNQLVLHYNNKNQEAEELFMTEHDEMLKDARQWIKETAQSCSAVAVLVATVVFAAAYTIPGGTDDHGRPIFLHHPMFVFFAVMDAISLASSLASVVMFLSVLTSPCEMWDFYKSLPKKLVLGFATLFFSLATTMLAFSATILLTIHLALNVWTTILTCAVLIFPVSLYALLQFPVAIKFLSRNFLRWVMKDIYRRTF